MPSKARWLIWLLVPLAAPVMAGPDIKDCRPGESVEMAQVIDWGANHWKEYEAHLERHADISVKNCLRNRFAKNGRVVCEQDMGGRCSHAKKGDANGWASPFNKRCHLCPDFLQMVRDKTGPENKSNRKACYFALISHEWAHTCKRAHGSVEKIDDEAFNFWKARNPDVSITLADCDMD